MCYYVSMIYLHVSAIREAKKGPDCEYDKMNQSVVICDVDISYRLTKSVYVLS
jgi:hypothetical protein